MAILPTGSSERDPGKYYSVSYGSTGGYMGTSGHIHTERESPVHHKQNETNQIMETEEQRAIDFTLAALYTEDLRSFPMMGIDPGVDAEKELSRILSEEIDKEFIKNLKRTINNVPTVSDRIKPISLALKK